MFENLLEEIDEKDPSESLQRPHASVVGIWLLNKDKARYDRLQKRLNRKVSKIARKMLLELMDVLESKAS